MSDDDQTLWTVSLYTRELLRLPIGVFGSAPDAGAIGRFAIPRPTGAGLCPNADDIRPFGLGYRNGLLYAGMVCSAQSTQNTADMRALVLSLIHIFFRACMISRR